MVQFKARRTIPIAVALTAAALVTAACGSSTSSTGSTTSSSATGSAAASGGTGVVVAGIPSIEELRKGYETTPPSSAPAPVKGKTIYWISCGQVSPACATKAAEGQKAATALGWTFHLIDGQFGQGGAYSNAIRTAIAAGADAIVEDAFPCSDVQQALQEAKDKNVAVVPMETIDCSDAGQGGPSLFTVPMQYGDREKTQVDWWTAFGKYSADYLIDATGGKALVINNPGRNTQQQLLDKGFKDELAKCADCKIVQDVPWSTAEYVPNGPWTKAFQAAVLKHPEANSVYMPFDGLPASLGGSAAVTSAGHKFCTGNPPYDLSSCWVGVGGIGTAESFDLTRVGKWTATGTVRSDGWIAWATVDELNRYFNKQPAASEGVGFHSIDSVSGLPANAGDPYVSPVDYAAAYKKAWGVS